MQNVVYNTIPFVYKSDFEPLCIHGSLYIFVYAKNLSFFMLYRNINKILSAMDMVTGSQERGRGHIFTLYIS